MTDSIVYRYPIPIDDQWHPVPGGFVVLVDTRRAEYVEVWVEHEIENGQVLSRAATGMRVFGTGQLIEDTDTIQHVGSVVARDEGVDGALVWHVYRTGAL